MRTSVELAIKQGRDSIAEFVFGDDYRAYYRVKLPRGIFYVVVKNGRCITLLTAEMFARIRTGRKYSGRGKRRKTNGKRRLNGNRRGKGWK